MAMETDQIKLPVSVATEIVNKAKDTSTIASLSPSTPQIFSDADYLVFNGKSEAEVVTEGAVKNSYEQTVDSVVAKRFKVQTTTRVTSELQWADEDNQLQIIRSIQADQAAALGRALDYVIYHAINPKTGAALSGFEPLSTSAVQVTAGDDDISNVDALADALNDSYDINGVALSKTWASRLRKLRVPSTGMRFYPEIPLNLQAGSLDGITAATSGTVNGRRATTTTTTKVLAFMGDFSLIKWGMVRDLTSEIIAYGDPDQTGVDLKAHNQIAYRTEAMYAFAVIDPNAFAVLKTK
jgi:HK97 family phage major capsid protein|nr:MAG TPA: major capsid protein [Caudoviricetes sp.]